MAKKIQAPGDLPTYDKLMWPIIQALRDLGGSASTEELLGKVVTAMNISEETQMFRRPEKARDELLLRSDWTKWYLRHANVVDYQNSLWVLLPLGRTITEKEVLTLPAKVRKLKSKASGKDLDGDESTEDEAANEISEETPKAENWRDELLSVAACKHKWSGSISSAFWTQIICNYRRCRAQIDCERTQIICDGTANINQWAQIH